MTPSDVRPSGASRPSPKRRLTSRSCLLVVLRLLAGDLFFFPVALPPGADPAAAAAPPAPPGAELAAAAAPAPALLLPAASPALPGAESAAVAAPASAALLPAASSARPGAESAAVAASAPAALLPVSPAATVSAAVVSTSLASRGRFRRLPCCVAPPAPCETGYFL